MKWKITNKRTGEVYNLSEKENGVYCATDVRHWMINHLDLSDEYEVEFVGVV